MGNGSTTSEKPKGLQMKLSASAENVAVVRHALAGLAEQVGMDATGIADLKTIVTEACMNVVVHAYDDDSGPLTVEAEVDAEWLTVIVEDSGSGIRPRADSERPSLKLGLSLIAALSSSFSISGGLGRGTEVMMRVPVRQSEASGDEEPVRDLKPGRFEGTEIAVGRSELLAPVLARLVGALAARRDLSIDRVSDAVLVTDAIAAAAPGHFEDGCVRLGLEEGENCVELRLGPMESGGAEEIREELKLPDVGGSLEALADGLTVREDGDGEYLVARFARVPTG
jgi:serine/threonine-protein kinase RsbW